MLDLIQTYGIYYLIGQYPNGPLGGLALTFLLASAGLVLALPAGIILGLCRVSPIAALRWPATALVYVVRGTPLLMVIFWAYFLLPSVTGQRTDQFSTMLTALVIFDGAYLAEIVRAGIQGLPRGQMESARSLGLSYMQAMRRVILPQALRLHGTQTEKREHTFFPLNKTIISTAADFQRLPQDTAQTIDTLAHNLQLRTPDTTQMIIRQNAACQ